MNYKLVLEAYGKKKANMYKYYVNKTAQVTGEHEVHKEGCYWLSLTQSVQYLGMFASGVDAVKAARAYYSNVDGCKYCCPEAHTR